MTKIGLILGILLPITKIYEHKYNEFLGYMTRELFRIIRTLELSFNFTFIQVLSVWREFPFLIGHCNNDHNCLDNIMDKVIINLK